MNDRVDKLEAALKNEIETLSKKEDKDVRNLAE
jgi:hypothetical protein